MSIDNDWITTQIDTGREANPSVTEAAANRVKELLKGRISDKQLRSKELSEIANELIIDMATPVKPSPKESL